jgi:5'-nucleotidase
MDGACVKRVATALALVACLLWSPAAGWAQRTDPGAPGSTAPLTILQVNDVYEMLPVDGAGGLARVATLKKTAAAAGRTPVLIIAGDFLSPSVASSVFKGRQMIAAFNAAGLDVATLGNHEFDFGDDALIERMGEARFQWVVANVIDTRTGRPIGGAAPYVLRTFGPLHVAFLGLCLNTTEISPETLTHTRIDDPIETAARYVPEMKRAGADVVVAVTHLAFDDDRRLAARFPDIDLIVGGHEHYPITATENRTLITKAGSDAKFVARIDVNRTAAGVVERFYSLIPVTAGVQDDPATLAVVTDFESRLGAELQAVIGTSLVPLDAETVRLRAGETNLGDFFADVIRDAAKADLAIVNSGSIRGERIYPAGTITRRNVIDMHPFGGVVCVVAVSGAVVRQALENGVSKLPASAGQFPQISGMTMAVDARAPAGSRVTQVLVNGQPLDPARTYSVAITDYMLGGGDDYTMFPGQRVLVSPESGSLIANVLEEAIETRKEIAPAVDGRIATTR